MSITNTLNSINRKNEEDGAARLAEAYELSYAQLDDYPFSFDVLSLVPFETVLKQLYAPYVRSADKIRIAVVNPDDDAVIQACGELGARLGLLPERTIVSRRSFRLLTEAYAHLTKEQKTIEEDRAKEAQEAEAKDFVQHIHSLNELNAQLVHTNTTEEIDAIMAAAYNQGASDVHIEPGEKEITIRFRIDGVLQEATKLPSTH
jgi:type II secretory ATPase GspE/PulE/Tfp pilus assembly ATPase PilB-like protein